MMPAVDGYSVLHVMKQSEELGNVPIIMMTARREAEDVKKAIKILKAGKKFIFSSTGGAMYGDGIELPADEETRAQPMSPYGINKS